MNFKDLGIDDSLYETWEDTPSFTNRRFGWKKSFYTTPAWRSLRKLVLDKYGCKCMKCNAFSSHPHVDHIKPRVYYPDLALDFDNLQVLCERCNFGKHTDECDYRPWK